MRNYTFVFDASDLGFYGCKNFSESCETDRLTCVEKKCVCVPQSWSQVVRQTEALGRVMRSHADDLNSGPLHRLATLIRDKQQVKKSYQSLHQQLESHNHKVGNPPGDQRCTTPTHPLTLLTEKTSGGQILANRKHINPNNNNNGLDL